MIVAFFKGGDEQDSFLIDFIEFNDIFCNCLCGFSLSFDVLFSEKVAFEAIEFLADLSNISTFEVILRGLICLNLAPLHHYNAVFGL